MTCVSNAVRPVMLIAMTLCSCALGALPFTATQEITSNDGYSLAGRGDTVWLMTRLGVNYTIALSDSLSWRGYKTDSLNGAMGFGDATALLCLRSGSTSLGLDKSVFANHLWIHRHSSGVDSIMELGFSKADSLFALSSSVDFSAVDVAWTAGAFWLACQDGGLVRMGSGQPLPRAIFPGSAKWFAPEQVTSIASTGVSKARLVDSMQRVISVKAQDISSAKPVVWALTPAKLWKFSMQDTTWDSVSSLIIDTGLTFSSYRQIYVAPDRDSLRLFAAIKVHNTSRKSDSISFFVFNNSAKSWRIALKDIPGAPAVTFGENGDLYAAIGNQVYLYRQAGASVSVVAGGDVFQKRMTLVSGGSVPDNVNDVLLLTRPNGKKSLWLATSTNSLPTANGLFFSLDEKADEADSAAFHYVHRDKKLSPALRESYAYPGILNALNNAKAVFAYNLSKASKVTIRVFDWNMDLVKTVIRDKDRPAGNDRTNGRSTYAAEDSWDGTNRYGKRVAVGVYYYKISAQSGEYAFGKIVVAQ